MNLSLLYKYQPKNLDEFEINNNLKQLLKTLIKMDSLNILFIGDAGSGKTSLINAIINEYYLNCPDIYSNILSINSLKEQGISYYRTEVKTFCQTTSSIYGKKKILILDDVDIINEQSQQVFRNCIDKYSNNVHFIASCMNPQKVIESIQSRMNIIKIKSFLNDELYKIMMKICTFENIIIHSDARDFIISICNNSVRILINYLEKFKLLEKVIDLELANKICTNIVFSDFTKYSKLCNNNNLSEAIILINSIFNKGYSVMDILDNYFLYIKSTELFSEDQKYIIISLICKYISYFHTIHEDEIELALFTNNLISSL
jgi:replication factor C subunit 2/4